MVSCVSLVGIEHLAHTCSTLLNSLRRQIHVLVAGVQFPLWLLFYEKNTGKFTLFVYLNFFSLFFLNSFLSLTTEYLKAKVDIKNKKKKANTISKLIA